LFSLLALTYHGARGALPSFPTRRSSDLERLSGGRRHLVPGTERALGRPHASVFGSLLEPPHLLDEACHAVALVAVDEPHLGRTVLLQNEVAVLVASLLRRRRRDIQQLRKRLDCPHTIAPCVLQRGVDA